MGQKISPIGLRVGITRDWSSRWVSPSKKLMAQWVQEDFKIRELLMRELKSAVISKIEIERPSVETIKLFIHTARPGIILGQQAKNLESVGLLVRKEIKKRHATILIEVVEIRNFGTDAMIIAQDIARRIEQRESYRFVQKKAILTAQRQGVMGIKIIIGGRLNGADISRKQSISFGKLPLSELDAKIDYGFATSKTTFGQMGIKVWVYQTQESAF